MFPDMDAQRKAQLDTYIWEAREHLDQLENDIIALQRSPGNPHLINSIFRGMHSIKGGAGFFAFQQIEQLSHELEQVMCALRDGTAEVPPALPDILLAGTDKLRMMIDHPDSAGEVDISKELDLIGRLMINPDQKAPRPTKPESAGPKYIALPPFRITPEQIGLIEKKGLLVYQARFGLSGQDAQRQSCHFIAKIESIGQLLDVITRLPQAGEPGGHSECLALFATVLQSDMIDIALELPREDYQEISRAELELLAATPPPSGEQPDRGHAGASSAIARIHGPEPASEKTGTTEETVRLPVSLLDDLMNLAGELVLGRNQLLILSDQMKEEIDGFIPALRNIDRVATGLRDKVMSTRLQPLGHLFQKFQRVVRDLATSLGKQIDLTISGQDVELDKSLIELLSDPLMHLIRNAADHGIEPPRKREAASKPLAGNISLAASHQAGRVIIRIADDGRGIDAERVRQKTVQRGLAREEDAAAMSTRQVLRFIFMPGFSTAEQITHISGRGVGMDVVKNNIEKIGGTIDLDSKVGEGTTVTLSLPLTVAVIPAMIVGVQDRIFAIPQAQLEELVSLKTSEPAIEHVRGAPVIRLRNRLLPLVNTARMLQLDQEARPAASYVAVIKSNQDRYGLLLDQVMDEEEIVVKPLSAPLKACSCYAGSTILGDGRIVLILDTAGIVNHTGLQFLEENSDYARKREAEQRRLATETQHLLLFRSAPDNLFAISQELLARIEKIRADQIEIMARLPFMTWQGKPLRLIHLEDWLPVDAPATPPESYYVLIPKLVKKPMGILCTALVDAIDISASLDREALQAKGLMGTAMLPQGLTLFLDIYGLFESVDPGTYAWQAGQSRLDGRRVLLAEDTVFFRTLVARYLESMQCRVDVAQDGLQAWEMLNRGQYDLLVTDLEMPGMNGFELTEQVRASSRLRRLPVVALTSISKSRYLDRAREAGVDAYELKVDKEQLRRTIDRLLNGPAPPPELQAARPPATLGTLPDLETMTSEPTFEDWFS